SALSLEEKRKVLDISEIALGGVLRARKGEGHVFCTSADDEALFGKMTDDDLHEVLELARLSRLTTNEADPRKSISMFRQIVARAPFDSIALISIGVLHFNLGDRRSATRYLEKSPADRPG